MYGLRMSIIQEEGVRHRKNYRMKRGPVRIQDSFMILDITGVLLIEGQTVNHVHRECIMNGQLAVFLIYQRKTHRIYHLYSHHQTHHQLHLFYLVGREYTCLLVLVYGGLIRIRKQ